MVNAKMKSGEKINGTEAVETAFKNGSEAFKTNFDKMTKGYDRVFGYGRETMEAYVKAANAAGKGVETINSEIYAFSKQSFEESVSAAKALFGSKSAHEAFELQTDFVKSAFEAYVSEITKISEIAFSTAKDAISPIQGRVQAWAEIVEDVRAA
ncbi:MAG TPA: phasin family protein [Rhizomicrobium sp.]|jgi:phasin family protein|nr:phasin family protein [Rhizomicrobium sp.]